MSYNVTLPSNVCMDMFRNTPSDYITQLSHHLQLDGQWVVGLTEVHIPCTWYNLTGSNNLFSIGMSTVDSTTKERIVTYVKYHLRQGYYATIEDILAAINIGIEKKTGKKYIEFHYSPASKRVLIKFKNHYQTFHFSKEGKLPETLGFKDLDFIPRHIDDPKLFKDTIIANYPPDMTGGVNGVYIYTDIVEHQYVGDKMAPLLRVVPMDRSQYVYHIIDAIELHLRTDFGEPLVFEGGKTLIKLHFKRVTA